jgi:hypothetical protein
METEDWVDEMVARFEADLAALWAAEQDVGVEIS